MLKSFPVASATVACVTKLPLDSTFGVRGLPPRSSFGSAFRQEFRISAKNRRSIYLPLSHRATDVGSNRTQVPMRNDGIRPAFACLKIVILETVNMLASSSAVNARPIRSIRSGSDIGSAVLFWGLHECIYLLCGFTSAATAAYCFGAVLWIRESHARLQLQRKGSPLS